MVTTTMSMMVTTRRRREECHSHSPKTCCCTMCLLGKTSLSQSLLSCSASFSISRNRHFSDQSELKAFEKKDQICRIKSAKEAVLKLQPSTAVSYNNDTLTVIPLAQ